MSSTNMTSKSASAGLFAAIAASLCCITPVFSLLAGIGGIAATFSWMEPFRPYLIALTIGVLGFAWFQKLRPRTKEEIECACETDEKPSFWQSKKFLGIVTIFATLMLAFPSYSHIFYPDSKSAAEITTERDSQIKLVEFKIKGMTCTACEEHVKHATLALDGVLEVKASHKEASAQVKFSASIVSAEVIAEAINKTGYTVTESTVSDWNAESSLFQPIVFNTIELSVKGMTCSGCESHVNNAVSQLVGVDSVKASYQNANTIVKYDPSKVEKDQIIDAINKTGYKVMDEKQITQLSSIQETENISFFKVPLVCNAATSIGCGSRSKPVLIDLENTSEVKEAWLNRQGSVIALVWSEDVSSADRYKTTGQILKKHNINLDELVLNDYAVNLDSFSKKENWYRGEDVNQLSKKEAAIIAGRLLKAIKTKTVLNPDQEQKLRTKIEASFYNFFLNFKSMDELGDPETHKKILSDIRTYGNSILAEGKMPELDELWSICATDAKSCNHSGSKDSSCCKSNKL